MLARSYERAVTSAVNGAGYRCWRQGGNFTRNHFQQGNRLGGTDALTHLSVHNGSTCMASVLGHNALNGFRWRLGWQWGAGHRDGTKTTAELLHLEEALLL